MRRVLLMYVFVLLSAIAVDGRAAEPSAQFVLEGPADADALLGHVDYYIDDDWSRTVPGMLGPDAGLFQPLPDGTASFGYTKSTIWLRIRVANATPNIDRWIVYFRENFKQVFEVHVAYPDGRITTPLRQSLETPFSTRPIDYPELAAPVDLPPDATATIFVRYWSEGASYLPMQIETPESFAEITTARTAKNFLYYGMVSLLIFAAMIALIIFRHGVFLAYFAYATSTLLFLAHADGVAFQHLWPDYPGFNSNASIVTGSAMIVFGSLYARMFLKTRTLHPIMDKLLLAIVAATLAVDVAAIFMDRQPIKQLLVLMALMAAVLLTASGLVAARTRFKEVRFYVFAWAGAMISAMLMTARHWLNIEVSQDFQFDSMRIVLVYDATMMGLAIIDSYNQLRASQQVALATGLAQAKHNLNLSGRLQDLERQFSLADELARSQGDALKDTIHDLRQPLNALRLRMHSIMQGDGIDADSRQDIETAFKYLETLVNARLEADNPSPEAARRALDADGVSLKETLESVRQMFLLDAKSKGLEFRLGTTSAAAVGPSLPLMRIVANLVANAIKYTDTGSVLVGVRQWRDQVRIEVHDTGPGMTATEFTRAQQRAIRLESGAHMAEGHGLGLAIARQIATEQGWTLSLSPLRKSGSGVVLTLPR